MKAKIQNPKPKILIVGAGPAGTGLAIRLAGQDFQVTLIEREKFPRQKLCGEFISPECLAHFQELGVLDQMLGRGGDRISETIFYSENGRNVAIPSEWFGGSRQGALGLSRAEMDHRLLEKAKEIGVTVREECSAAELLMESGDVRGIKIRRKNGETDDICADLTIDATGRARVLGKLADRAQSGKIQSSAPKRQNSLVGFKAHLKNVDLPKGRCEIYFFRGGYGGLNYVEDGLANHCFLIKAEIVREFKGNVGRILENVIFKNERARETLAMAENVYDWLAVTVDGFGIKDLNPAGNLLAVGDAAAFIDPFTGSGMLMALESAEILAGVVAGHGAGSGTIVREYESRHRARFQRRLRVCAVMRRLAFAPNFAKTAISVLSLSRRAREVLARSTRKAPSEKSL